MMGNCAIMCIVFVTNITWLLFIGFTLIGLIKLIQLKVILAANLVALEDYHSFNFACADDYSQIDPETLVA